MPGQRLDAKGRLSFPEAEERMLVGRHLLLDLGFMRMLES